MIIIGHSGQLLTEKMFEKCRGCIPIYNLFFLALRAPINQECYQMIVIWTWCRCCEFWCHTSFGCIRYWCWEFSLIFFGALRVPPSLANADSIRFTIDLIAVVVVYYMDWPQGFTSLVTYYKLDFPPMAIQRFRCTDLGKPTIFGLILLILTV